MKHFHVSLISLICFLIGFTSQTAEAAIYRVNANSPCTTGCDGSTWAKAFNNPQAAIDVAGDGDEIWITAGVYWPVKTREGDYTPGDNRLKTFYINEDLVLLGGFVGNETTKDQRNPALYPLTILSGNLGAVGVDDNAYHVLWVEDAQVDLNGFKITEGNGNHPTDALYNRGGGVYVRCSYLDLLSCQVEHNRAVNGAGAFVYASYNNGGGDQVLSCDSWLSAYATQFTSNIASNLGGAIEVTTAGWNDDGHVYLEGCNFSGNRAASGGAVYCRPSFGHVYTQAVYCTFENNQATSEGGAIRGLIGNTTSELHLSADNCIFRGNKAATGGAVMIHISIHDLLQSDFNNCLFYNNEATTAGAAIHLQEADNLFQDLDIHLRCRFSTFYNNKGPATQQGNAFSVNSAHNIAEAEIENCIFWGNSTAPGVWLGQSASKIANTLVQGAMCEQIGSVNVECYWQTLIFNQDPQFVDAANANFNLHPCSPAVNAAISIGGLNSDLLGSPRSQQGAPDMGALETATPLPPLNIQCKNIEIPLHPQQGTATFIAGAFDNGTTGCAPFTFKVNGQELMSVNCLNVGTQTVTLTVTDAKGRTATCTPTLTVKDVTPPQVFANDATIYLNATGTYTLGFMEINFVASENCSVAGRTLSRTQFTCADLDQVIPVTVTVKDPSNNTTEVTVMITVKEGKTLPTGWSHTGIDNATGNAEYSPCTNNGTYKINSTGFPANLMTDKRYVASRQLCGDGEIKAHIASISGGGWAGLTMRDGTTAGAKMVALKMQLGSNQVMRESRPTANGIKQMQSSPQPQQPSWLKLVRISNGFYFYSSLDGIAWQLLGSVTIPMSNCLRVGLFTESLNATAITTAAFDQVQVVGSLTLGMEETGFDLQETLQTATPNIHLFPNPAYDAVQVQLEGLEEGAVMLRVFDQSGKQVMSRQISYQPGNMENLSVQELPSGLYILKAGDASGKQVSSKLAVQH